MFDYSFFFITLVSHFHFQNQLDTYKPQGCRDYRSLGLLRFWTIDLLDCLAVGQWRFRTIDLLDCLAVGQSRFRTIDLLDCLAFGLSSRQTIELSDWRAIELRRCWSRGPSPFWPNHTTWYAKRNNSIERDLFHFYIIFRQMHDKYQIYIK